MPARAAGERLNLEAPPVAAPPSLIPWIEVRGRAGMRPEVRTDLVLVIDLSDSTLVDSGYDADGDGHFPEGTTSPASIRRLSLDSDDPQVQRLRKLDLEDSILMAEIEAAELLIERLDLETTRVAIVAFSDAAHPMCKLVSDRAELERVFSQIRRRFPAMLGATNFAAALSVSAELLDDPEASRSIIFLSDGQPTRPDHPYQAYKHAVAEAHEAAQRGIRIYPFALGPEAIHSLDVYDEMAKLTGGRVERLGVPAEVVPRLGALDLAGLQSVSFLNLTTGKRGMTVRTFPNGRFDGFVELAPGENQIRIDAVLTDGERIRLERGVTRLHPDALTREQREHARAQLASLLEELRVRSMKLEILAEMRRARRGSVKVEPYQPGSATGPQ